MALIELRSCPTEKRHEHVPAFTRIQVQFRDFALISSKTKMKEKEMVAKVRKMH